MSEKFFLIIVSLLLITFPELSFGGIVSFTPLTSIMEYTGLYLQSLTLNIVRFASVFLSVYIVVKIAISLVSGQKDQLIRHIIVLLGTLILLIQADVGETPKVYSSGTKYETLGNLSETEANAFRSIIDQGAMDLLGVQRVDVRGVYPSWVLYKITEIVDASYLYINEGITDLIGNYSSKNPMVFRSAMFHASNSRIKDPTTKKLMNFYYHECYQQTVIDMGKKIPNKSLFSIFWDVIDEKNLIFEEVLAEIPTNLLKEGSQSEYYNCNDIHNFLYEIFGKEDVDLIANDEENLKILRNFTENDAQNLNIYRYMKMNSVMNFVKTNITDYTGENFKSDSEYKGFWGKIGRFIKQRFEKEKSDELVTWYNIEWFGEDKSGPITDAYDAFVSSSKLEEMTTTMSLIQGFVLMAIYIMAGFVPLVVLISGSFSILQWYIILIVWVKMWPTGWILCSHMYQFFFKISDEGEMMKNMSFNIEYETITYIQERLSTLNDMFNVFYMIIPFATAALLKVTGVGIVSSQRQ